MTPGQGGSDKTWLLYATRTADCAPLDRNIYPVKPYHDGMTPWPPWAGTSSGNGIHKDNRVKRIDVHLSSPPKKKDEISWTCEFQVKLVARTWLDRIEDLLDPSSVGKVFLHGQELSQWATIHEANPPLVMMKEGWRKRCPICGGDNNVIYKGKFFSDPAVLERDAIVTGEGVLVRESLVLSRDLAPPKGGYKPVRVPYRPEWLAQMRLMTPPDFSR